MFSNTCLCIAAFANARKMGNTNEKIFSVLFGTLIAIMPIRTGLRLSCEEDLYTARVGTFFITIGVMWLVIYPPTFFLAASSWNRLSDKHLSKASTKLFISTPSALGLILYISAASLRCMIQCKMNESVIKQCGNPIAPTFLISALTCLR